MPRFEQKLEMEANPPPHRPSNLKQKRAIRLDYATSGPADGPNAARKTPTGRGRRPALTRLGRRAAVTRPARRAALARLGRRTAPPLINPDKNPNPGPSPKPAFKFNPRQTLTQEFTKYLRPGRFPHVLIQRTPLTRPSGSAYDSPTIYTRGPLRFLTFDNHSNHLLLSLYEQ